MSWDGCARGGRRAGVCFFMSVFTEGSSTEDLKDSEGTYLTLGAVCYQLCFPNLGARPLGRELTSLQYVP